MSELTPDHPGQFCDECWDDTEIPVDGVDWQIITEADLICMNPTHRQAIERLAAIEVLVASAEYRERTSLSRTFGGGSFGASVDAAALRKALTPPAGGEGS